MGVNGEMITIKAKQGVAIIDHNRIIEMSGVWTARELKELYGEVERMENGEKRVNYDDIQNGIYTGLEVSG